MQFIAQSLYLKTTELRAFAPPLVLVTYEYKDKA